MHSDQWTILHSADGQGGVELSHKLIFINMGEFSKLLDFHASSPMKGRSILAESTRNERIYVVKCQLYIVCIHNSWAL